MIAPAVKVQPKVKVRDRHNGGQPNRQARTQLNCVTDGQQRFLSLLSYKLQHAHVFLISEIPLVYASNSLYCHAV